MSGINPSKPFPRTAIITITHIIVRETWNRNVNICQRIPIPGVGAGMLNLAWSLINDISLADNIASLCLIFFPLQVTENTILIQDVWNKNYKS